MNIFKSLFWHPILSLLLFVQKTTGLIIKIFPEKSWFLLRLRAHQKEILKKEIKAHGEFIEGVDIVVCIHNALEDVQKCLDSILKSTNLYKNSLILVDDGSQPETASFVKAFVTRWSCGYIRNEVAQGYTKAANLGLKFGNKKYAVLLNSDTIVAPGWLDSLVECIQSQENVAAVGPLSNAASWQSIPDLFQSDGKWAVNDLPPQHNLESLNAALKMESLKLYPELSFVNGFCLLLARKVLKEIGDLDEKSFPRGYGEEDDFILRAQKAGYRCLLADDVYVYHSKSKSFTPEGRLEIVEKSKKTLRTKHGADFIKSKIQQIQYNENLLKSRWYASRFWFPQSSSGIAKTKLRSQKVLWLSPHLKKFGGIRRLIEMTNRLVACGYDVTIATPSGESDGWLPINSKIKKNAELVQDSFDIAICGDPSEASLFLAIKAKTKLVYHLAAYHLYREENDRLDTFYSMPEDVLHLTNSHWTAEQIRQFYPKIEAVLPGGVQRKVFRPMKARIQWDISYYGSNRPHKGSLRIEDACRGYSMLPLDGVTRDQEELAWALNSTKAFVSACFHEGFNFMPLEAMACGIPVVVMDDGGSRNYAQHEVNSLVVPQGDLKALRESVNRILTDKNLRMKVIEGGLKTSLSFDWDGVTQEFIQILEKNS